MLPREEGMGAGREQSNDCRPIKARHSKSARFSKAEGLFEGDPIRGKKTR